MSLAAASQLKELADTPRVFWEAWAYWRTVTILLALLWLVTAVGRLLFFHHRWERRLEEFGATRRWLRGQLLRVILRTTVLDPVNLALMLAIVAIWSVPWLWI